MNAEDKAGLIRAINASGMSTAEMKTLTKIVNSVPAAFWGTSQVAALTTADGSTVDGTYGTEESDVISNNVVRIGEIEAALQAFGILA